MNKPVILCVDDEKIILDSLREQVLSRLGDQFDCEVAESGDEGLEIIDELKEDGIEVAVVISDQLMPGMKGDEFLIEVHKLLPETLKILLTGQASFDAVQNAINNARLYRYVVKPWDENDLMMTIEEAASSYLQHTQLMENNEQLQKLNNATQELSSEMNIDNLNEKFLTYAVRNTNAERGYLFFESENGLHVEALLARTGGTEKFQRTHNGSGQAILDELLGPLQETLAGVGPDYRFAAPIAKQNKQFGYVYLENRLSRNTFNTSQQEIVRMLSGQAAISLDNAGLYSTLHDSTAQLQRQKERAVHITQVIGQRNAEYTQNIRFAKRIQMAIMPEHEPLKAQFPDSMLIYRPKDIVSGDFYWWNDRPDAFIFAAVDCTGHGVPGALMSVIGSSFLNQIVNEYALIEPDAILQYLNLRVRTTLKQDRQSLTKDGMDLAICSWHKKNHTLTYAGARRPLFYVRDGVVQEYGGTKASIGETMLDGSEPIYLPAVFTPEKGDAIYIFSDGVPDQFGGPNNRKFTTRRLIQILSEIYNKPMVEQEAYLNATFDEWRGDVEQTDDMLMIGIRF